MKKIYRVKKMGLARNLKIIETKDEMKYNSKDKIGCGCNNPEYIHTHFTTHFNDKKGNKMRTDFGSIECKNCKNVFMNYH